MVSPLADVRVVEVANWMAAPSAAAVLADMGADVIKVEPLTGDVVRGLMRQPKLAEGAVDIDHSFQVDNRGKRSIAVALDRPEGRRAGAPARRPRRRLPLQPAPAPPAPLRPRSGDAARPPTAARPRHADRVRAHRPRGVPPGLRRDDVLRPGRDHRRDDRARWRRAEPPAGPGRPHDGLAMVAAILAALRLVDRTGEGQVVDVSLLATAAWTMASDLAATLVDGRSPSKRDRHHLIAPLANRFRCADDRWIVLNMPEVRWWAPFCEADRPARRARGSAVRHGARAVRQHAGS